MSSEGLEADHGVRFIIVEDENSPYRFGKWIPLSTSDNGSAWGGSPEWVRAQSAAIAKAIWWHRHWDYRLSISYTGITDTEKDDFERFMRGRLAQLEEEEAREEEIHQRELAEFSGDSDKAEREWVTRKYNESLMRCKADWGEMSPTLQCTKCKFTRRLPLDWPHCTEVDVVPGYCSVACQKEDWKVYSFPLLCAITHVTLLVSQNVLWCWNGAVNSRNAQILGLVTRFREQCISPSLEASDSDKSSLFGRFFRLRCRRDTFQPQPVHFGVSLLFPVDAAVPLTSRLDVLNARNLRVRHFLFSGLNSITASQALH